jgi:hypothetical protein
MGRTGTLSWILTAAALAAVHSVPADAQCRLCTKPTVGVDQSLTDDDLQIEVETNLDFDRLVLADSGPGNATLRTDGSDSPTGSVADISPRARVATVVVHGQPGRLVRIEIPPTVTLFSLEGGRLTFDQVLTDAPDLPKLDAGGNLTFHIGGRLRFAGGEDGNFRGDLPVTVEYQ